MRGFGPRFCPRRFLHSGFNGKIIVIKYGGSAQTDSALKEGFAQDVVLLKYVGILR